MRHRPEYSNLTCGPQQWLLQLHESSPRCRKNVIRIAANRSELRTKNKKRRRKRLASFPHDLLFPSISADSGKICSPSSAVNRRVASSNLARLAILVNWLSEDQKALL